MASLGPVVSFGMVAKPPVQRYDAKIYHGVEFCTSMRYHSIYSEYSDFRGYREGFSQ